MIRKRTCMKKLLTIIITTAILISNISFAVSAATEYHVTDTVDFYTCWQKAIKDKGSTIVLDRDMTIEWNGYVLGDDADITIDLNGHSIKGTGSDAEYIFMVEDDAKLTIDDTSTDKTGFIQINNKSGKYKAVIGVDDDDAQLVLNNGSLKGNDDSKSRILIIEDGTLRINGGSICDNTYGGWGSAIYINEGSFYMTGGEICNNIAEYQNDYPGCGGAIYYDGGSSTVFEMTGGRIHDNEATSGGGIYFADGGKYTTFGSGRIVLSGGEIDHNRADCGGGIFADNDSDGVELTGTLLIDKNSADEHGGGVYVNRYDAWLSDCSIILGGSVHIQNNGRNDVYSDPRYDAIEIDENINTSPDKHAWIGIEAAVKNYPMDRDQDYYDYSFNEDDNDREYSVCFFGRDWADRNAQTVMVRDDGDIYFILTHNTKAMRGVSIDSEAIVGKDGQRLVSGWNDDYMVDMHDDINLSTTIESKKGMILNEDTMLLYTRRPECESITLQSVNGEYAQKEIGTDSTTYTLYYLVKNKKVKTENDRTYYQDYYEKVVIEVSDHKVSYDLNGHAAGTTIPAEQVKDWDVAHEPEEPIDNEGFDFQGWFLDKECTERYDFSESVTEDMVLYAGWATIGPPPLLCVVTFDMNSHGIQIDPEGVGFGMTVTKPSDPNETGWSFNGWFKEPECLNMWDFANDTVTGDITLYAGWTEITPDPEPGQLIVNYDMNGHGTQIPYQSIAINSKVTKPADPTEIGYEFINWYTDKGCTTLFDFDTELVESITLYAKWAEGTTTCIATFVGNYDGSTYMQEVEETYNTAYRLPDADPQRDGYAFVGWFSEKTFGDRIDEETLVGRKIDHTIYAQWKKMEDASCNPPEAIDDLEYDGTLQSIAYTGATKDGTMYYAVSDSENATIADDDWQTSIEKKMNAGTYYIHYYVKGDSYHNDSQPAVIVSTIGKKEPLYIAPEPKFNLVYNDELQNLVSAGSSDEGTIYYAVSDSSDVPDAGWSTGLPAAKDVGTYCVHFYVDVDDDKNYKNTEPEMVVVTILPKESFTVKFDMNGHGTQIADDSVPAGSMMDKPTDPTDSKYTFMGWYKESGCMNPWDFAKDTVTQNPTTIYAGWKANRSSIAAEPNGLDLVYNNNPQKLVEAGSASGGTLRYAISTSKEAPSLDDEVWSTEIPEAKDAGTYYIHYYVKGDDTHIDSGSEYVKATIRKAEPGDFTHPIEKEDLKYNTFMQELVEAGSSDEGTIYYSLSDSPDAPGEEWTSELPKAKDVGTYYVHYYLKGDSNHTDSETFCTAAIKIEKGYYNVSFETDGLAKIDPQTVEGGMKVEKPSDPSAVGYIFMGWYSDASFRNRWNFDSDVVTKDMTLYARWSKAIVPYVPPKTGA